MIWWKFKNFRPVGGPNMIKDWFDRQDVEIRADFLVTLQKLSVAYDWGEIQDVEELSRTHPGLWEIKLKVVQQRGPKQVVRQLRPCGMVVFAPDLNLNRAGEFLLILGCEKKANRTIPEGAFDTALRYRQNYFDGKGYADENAI